MESTEKMESTVLFDQTFSCHLLSVIYQDNEKALPRYW